MHENNNICDENNDPEADAVSPVKLHAALGTRSN